MQEINENDFNYIDLDHRGSFNTSRFHAKVQYNLNAGASWYTDLLPTYPNQLHHPCLAVGILDIRKKPSRPSQTYAPAQFEQHLYQASCETDLFPYKKERNAKDDNQTLSRLYNYSQYQITAFDTVQRTPQIIHGKLSSCYPMRMILKLQRTPKLRRKPLQTFSRNYTEKFMMRNVHVMMLLSRVFHDVAQISIILAYTGCLQLHGVYRANFLQITNLGQTLL